MISSENLDKCIIKIAQADAISTQKSLSDTPSKLFLTIPSKFNLSATNSLSIGYVVPAKAQDPNGE